ncbi:MAG: cytochrome c maturation protein CcmE [Polyangiales bacterium]
MTHSSTDSTAAEPGKNISSFVKIGVVFVLLAGAVAFLLVGSDASDAFVYAKYVDEVMGTPAEFEGRRLRVEGDLREGSIQFREDPCEWRFVLIKGEETMPVRFPQCVVPDTFRDGAGLKVTVEGKLEGDTFLATQVIPRCPSKYEMDQRLKAGEAMPHAGALAVPDTAVN